MEKLKKIAISPQLTVRQVLQHIDGTGERTLFVIDGSGVIMGSVTDGDIRRWILKGKRLGEPISKVMFKNPVTVNEDYNLEEIKNLMVSRRMDCVPVLNKKRELVSSVRWIDLFGKKIPKQKIHGLPVILMAGGEGKRLHPFTSVLPKPLMLIGQKTIVERIIDNFIEFGCKEFYLSINYKANLIKAYFTDLPKQAYKIKYILEDKPLGTAGSLVFLKDKINTTFCVSNCDVLVNADLSDIVKFHKKSRNAMTLVGSMKHFTIHYGVCKVEKNGILQRIEEKPEYDYLVNTGMYILEPKVLKYIQRNKMFHMTDLIAALKTGGQKVGVYPISEKSWLDMGQFEELKEMLKKYGE